MIYTQTALFYTLWRDPDTKPEEFYKLAKRIFRGLTQEKWSKALQTHNILHNEEDVAMKEFQAALFEAGGEYDKIFK